MLEGTQSQGQAGFSVSGTGDVTGDGIDDILIGAGLPIASRGGATAPATNYLVYGRARDNPWPSVFDMINLQINVSDGTQGVIIKSNRAADGLGMQVAAAGDFTGDGIDDLLMGAASSGQLAERSTRSHPGP